MNHRYKNTENISISNPAVSEEFKPQRCHKKSSKINSAKLQDTKSTYKNQLWFYTPKNPKRKLG